MYLGAIAESFPCHVQRVWNGSDGWYGMETMYDCVDSVCKANTSCDQIFAKAFVDSCVVI